MALSLHRVGRANPPPGFRAGSGRPSPPRSRRRQRDREPDDVEPSIAIVRGGAHGRLAEGSRGLAPPACLWLPAAPAHRRSDIRQSSGALLLVPSQCAAGREGRSRPIRSTRCSRPRSRPGRLRGRAGTLKAVRREGPVRRVALSAVVRGRGRPSDPRSRAAAFPSEHSATIVAWQRTTATFELRSAEPAGRFGGSPDRMRSGVILMVAA